MSSFILKSYRAGISDYEDKGLEGSFKVGRNLDIRKETDSLSCQQTLIAEGTGVIAELIKWIVPSIDGNTYLFSDLGKVYKRTSAGVVTLVYTAGDEYSFIGAAEWFCSNGKTYLFWATPTDLNCKEIPGNAAWTDVNASVVVGATTYTYPKTNLTSSDWHTMIQAVGSLQIANGNYLAMVGYDGSYTPTALNLFKKHTAKALLERGNNVYVGAPRADSLTESNLVEWDTDSGSWNDIKPVKGGDINAMIDTDIPLLQVGTDGGLYYGDMQNRLSIMTIPGGGYCNPSGVTNDGNLALFGIYGNSENRNGIYSYGKNKLNEASHVLNLEYEIGACDEIGAICKVGSDILISYKVGTSYYLKKVNTAAKATAYYYSLDLKAPAKLGYMPTWGPILLTMKALPASCKVEVFYKLDKTGDWIQAKMEGDISEFTTTGGMEAVFMAGEKARILEVQIKLTPSVNTTPEIYKAEIFFE